MFQGAWRGLEPEETPRILESSSSSNKLKLLLLETIKYIEFIISEYLLPMSGKYIPSPPSYEADNSYSEFLSINPTISGGVLGSDLYVFFKHH